MDEGVRDRFKVEWPAQEPRTDHASFDGIRDAFRAAWPGYEAYVAALRAVSPQGLDPNIGNVLMGLDGCPIVNDPLCDDRLGLWRSPLLSLLMRSLDAVLRLTGEVFGRAPVTA